ncbi:MAG: imelysin family protein [Colwellia sp.]
MINTHNKRLAAKVSKYFPNILLATVFSLTLTACGGSDSSGGGVVEPDDNTTLPTYTIEDEFGLWLTDLADNHVLPSYQRLLENALTLSSQATDFCANETSSDELFTLQQSWRDVMLSWQTIQWLKVGPIIDDNRIYRLHYWPDSKDTVSTGVAALLATTEVVTESYISTRSVGSQGLPAIENLLFSATENDLVNADDKAKRCEVLVAISANVATISREVNSEWQISEGNYYAQLTQGTGDFTGKTDAVEELVTNWLEQLERVKDEKMLTPLADDIPGLPSELEHELSEFSMVSIQQNIATFMVIYTAGDGHGFDDILIDYLSQHNIATEMLTALENAIVASNALTGNGTDLLNSAEGRAQITVTIEALRILRDILTVDFVQAMDINIGFNSNDGD